MKFQASETVVCKIEVFDTDNNLTTPTSIVISVTNPDGTVKIDESTPTNDSTGKYSYKYNIPSSPEEGRWIVEWKVTDDTAVTITRDYFEVEE